MIHFELRRSLRLVTDFLSLTCAAPGKHLRFEHRVHRGETSNTSRLLRTDVHPDLDLTPLPSPDLTAVNIPSPPAGSRGHLYLTSTGLLLALSLEICGCNPVSNPVTSANLAFDALIDGHSGEQATRVEQTLSFYDPADQPPAPSSTALAFSDLYLGPRPIPSETKSPPWAIPESVYFVYRGRRPGELRPRQTPLATAFVLAVPSMDRNSRDPDRIVRFLVTARHVVDPQWAHCADQNPVSIDVRLNRREGGVGYETVSLNTGAAPRFFTPSDPTADLAVIPLDRSLIANIDDYKFLDVPFRLLLTSSDMPLIHLEQPIMTAGLSILPAGGPASFPVFDAGSLSEMPVDTVDVRCGIATAAQSNAKLLHVWFIDAGLPQGVSGAPVFTSIARGTDGVKTPVLLGVQSVVWPDRGVAGITPSPILSDLIRSALRCGKPGRGLSDSSK